MSEPPKEPVKYVEANVRLPYHYVAGDVAGRFVCTPPVDQRLHGSALARVLVPPHLARHEFHELVVRELSQHHRQVGTALA